MKTPETWAEEYAGALYNLRPNPFGQPRHQVVTEFLVGLARAVQEDAAREYAGIIHDVSQESGTHAAAFARGAEVARGQLAEWLREKHRDAHYRRTEQAASGYPNDALIVAGNQAAYAETMNHLEFLGAAVPLPEPEVTGRLRQVLAWCEGQRDTRTASTGQSGTIARYVELQALREFADKLREALGEGTP